AERQNAIRRITRYNPTWQANQVLNEFMTLDQSLRMFRDGESDVDKEEVQLRYDIFAGTINSLAEGGFREVLEQEPSFESTIHDLEGPTNDVAPLIKDLNSPEDALAALQILSSLQSSLKQLPSVTFNYGATLAT